MIRLFLMNLEHLIMTFFGLNQKELSSLAFVSLELRSFSLELDSDNSDNEFEKISS